MIWTTIMLLTFGWSCVWAAETLISPGVQMWSTLLSGGLMGFTASQLAIRIERAR